MKGGLVPSLDPGTGRAGARFNRESAKGLKRESVRSRNAWRFRQQTSQLRHSEQVTATLSPLHWKETHPGVSGILFPKLGSFLGGGTTKNLLSISCANLGRRIKADSSRTLLRNLRSFGKRVSRNNKRVSLRNYCALVSHGCTAQNCVSAHLREANFLCKLFRT